MLLSDIFDRRSIKLNLEGSTKEAVLNQLVTLVNSEALTMIRTAKNIQEVQNLLSRFG